MLPNLLPLPRIGREDAMPIDGANPLPSATVSSRHNLSQHAVPAFQQEDATTTEWWCHSSPHGPSPPRSSDPARQQHHPSAAEHAPV